MTSMHENVQNDSRINDSAVGAAIEALAPFHPADAKEARNMLLFWVRRQELTELDIAEVQNRMFPRDDKQVEHRYQPDAGRTYSQGYADGYVDCATVKSRMAATPPRTLEQSRHGLVETAMSALITVGMLSKESADSLISIWMRRDQLTPVELDMLQAATED